MKQLVITCPTDKICEQLKALLLGTHPRFGYDDRPTSLTELVDIASDGELLNITSTEDGIQIQLSEIDGLIKPRLSKAAISALENGFYRAVCRLRGPKWNSDGEMVFKIEHATETIKYGAKGKHSIPAGTLMYLSPWSEEWAEYEGDVIQEDGMIGDDQWYMEILSTPIKIDEPPSRTL